MCVCKAWLRNSFGPSFANYEIAAKNGLVYLMNKDEGVDCVQRVSPESQSNVCTCIFEPNRPSCLSLKYFYSIK